MTNKAIFPSKKISIKLLSTPKKEENRCFLKFCVTFRQLLKLHLFIDNVLPSPASSKEQKPDFQPLSSLLKALYLTDLDELISRKWWQNLLELQITQKPQETSSKTNSAAQKWNFFSPHVCSRVFSLLIKTRCCLRGEQQDYFLIHTKVSIVIRLI